MRGSRLIAVLALCFAVLAGTTACSPRGDRGVSQQQEKSNLDLQRESALIFREDWPNVEKIRFKREGGRPGLGASWRVNAVATVEGIDYEVIIGPSVQGSAGGGGLPPAAPVPHTPVPLTVTYSDGTSEVIR